MSVDPKELQVVAERLAADAADFVRGRRAEVFGDAPGWRAGDAMRAKSTPTDTVTIVDTETERLLRDRLAQLRPGEPVLGEEEGGSVDAGDDRLTWVLDPIDGTVNFVYGIPAYAVSVGVQQRGRSVAGAVANVAAGTIYSAARGYGARVRQSDGAAPLQCSALTDLSLALVGTGFAYAREKRLRQAQILQEVLPEVRDIRRIGSCALDLCMVAAGQLDGYYEDGVHVWDWAAGALIATEAGAQVRLPGIDSAGLIVAAAPGVADALAAALTGAGVDL